MKYVKTFENHGDYLAHLRKDSELRSSLDKIPHRRNTEDFRRKLSDETESRNKVSQMLEDREKLTHLVIQSLIYCSRGEPGFDNFQSELDQLLSKYPIDRLPKSGRSIYRKID